MPIATGQKGRPGARGIPGDRFLGGKPFRSQPFSTSNTFIAGQTRDSTGAPLGSCVVILLLTGGDVAVAKAVSDASGNYRFDNPGSGPFYIVAYKPGSPDVAGTTVNTLVAQ